MTSLIGNPFGRARHSGHSITVVTEHRRLHDAFHQCQRLLDISETWRESVDVGPSALIERWIEGPLVYSAHRGLREGNYTCLIVSVVDVHCQEVLLIRRAVCDLQAQHWKIATLYEAEQITTLAARGKQFVFDN
jgi:hypothetical protein